MGNKQVSVFAILTLTTIAAGAMAQPARGTRGAAPAPPMVGASAPVQPGTMVDPAKALDDMLTPFEEMVLGVAEEMPADKYGFAPKPGIFVAGQNAAYETVMTFGAEIAHLASANYYFYSSATGMKPEADVKAISQLKSKAELIAALKVSFAFAHKAITTINAGNAFEAIKPVDGQGTRATLAAFAVAHGNDHYGQLVEYLRMNGLVPPGSKK